MRIYTVYENMHIGNFLHSPLCGVPLEPCPFENVHAFDLVDESLKVFLVHDEGRHFEKLGGCARMVVLRDVVLGFVKDISKGDVPFGGPAFPVENGFERLFNELHGSLGDPDVEAMEDVLVEFVVCSDLKPVLPDEWVIFFRRALYWVL